MNENYGLDRIWKVYDILLFDASVIFGPFNELSLCGKSDSGSMCDKRDLYRLNIDYTRYLQNGVQKGKPFFVTSLIHRELQRQGNSPFKNLKKFKRNSVSTLVTLSRERDRLIAYLSNYNKIVSFSEVEIKNYGRVRGDLEKGLDPNLSEPDKDFLFTGVVLALNRGRVALLSNDKPILDSYENIIRENYRGLRENNIWFFKGCRGRDFFLPCYVNKKDIQKFHSSGFIVK